MRRFAGFAGKVMMAVCAVCALSCEGVSPDEGSFFNAPFYGIAPGEVGGVVTAGADGRLTLVWNAAKNASSYEVFYGGTPDAREAAPLTVTKTSVVIPKLENGVEYYLWIRAKNDAGTSALYGPVRASPLAALNAPDAPAAPRATALSGMVALEWQPVEGALRYDVWKGVSDNRANAQKCAEDIDALAFTVEGLNNETTYYFWVGAKNTIGESLLSEVISATPTSELKPPAEPSAPILTLGSGQLTLSWQPVTSALRYEIWIATENNNSKAVKHGGDTNETSAVITGLNNGTRYYVWLKAKNNRGVSGFSPASNAIPTAFDGPPAAPAAPMVTLGSGKATFAWQAVAGTLAYEVWMAQSNNSASATQYGGDISSGLSITISGLTNGASYWVWLKAKNNVGTSGFSLAAQAKPIADAAVPTLAVESSQLSVQWAAIVGAEQYDLFYGTGVNPLASPVWSGTGTSTTLTGLINGTTYSVWVRGKNTTGVGMISAAVSAVVTNKGLYKGEAFTTAVKIGTYNLEQSLSSISGNALSGDNYYIVLGADESLGPKSLFYSNKTVGITLMADDAEKIVQLASNGSLFSVYSGVTLTLENNVTLRGRADNTQSLVYILSSSGKFIMNGGKISGNSSPASQTIPGGVYVGSGTFTMSGGKISDNSSAASYGGGGVSVGGGTFTMSGGEISGNSADFSSGGGVSVGSGTFTMSGGEISGNYSAASSYGGGGGGVFVGTGGTFTMSGGKISSNSAASSSSSSSDSGRGGGINVLSGTFIMSGGEISGNSTVSFGGGVHISNLGTFTKSSSGGVITGYGSDTATGNKVVDSSGVVQSGKGHAVYVYSSPAKKKLEKTVPANKALDSSQDGAAGGWTE